METIKVAFSNDMPQEIHFSFCSPEFHAIRQYPNWCVAFEGEHPGARCTLRENHFLEWVKIIHTSCKKPQRIFVGIDYFTKSWSKFMGWIIELRILCLFITGAGDLHRGINPWQRFRRGQLLSYYGGESLSMSINYQVPVPNKNIT